MFCYYDKNVCVFGYIDKMNDILVFIDVLVSKFGGFIIIEVFLKDVFMIVFYYILG